MNQIKATSLDQFTLAWKVFVLMPIARMAELSREAGVRLIYVFIPPQRNQSLYSRNVELLKKLLTDKGAEFVDVQSALIPKDSELMKTGHSQLAWVWPRELKSILQFRSMRTVQREDKFIDWVHPTVKGNAIIAEHVYRYLTEGPEAQETGLPDKR
jgi:hypothetical protein